jgi:hypothetical protein
VDEVSRTPGAERPEAATIIRADARRRGLQIDDYELDPAAQPRQELLFAL